MVKKASPGRVLTRDVKTRIDEDLHRRVIERARAEDRSESAIVRMALRQFLGTDEGGGRRPRSSQATKAGT